MDTRRLILVLIFTFSSFMLWENWQKHNQPTPVADTAAASANGSAAPKPSASLQAGNATAPAVTPAVAPAGETFVITTDLIKATVSTQGGDLVKLELLNYKEHEDKSQTFVLFDSKHHYVAQSGLIGDGLPTHRSLLKRVAGPSELAAGSNELKVRLEGETSNGVKVAKILSFKRGSYSVDVAWEIVNGSDKAIAPHAYFQLQRNDAAPAGETKMVSTFTGPAVYTDAEKYQKVDFSAISDNKAKFAKTADNGWLAMVQHYFVSAWVPKEKTQREFYMRKLDGGNVFQAGLIVPVAEIAPNSRAETTVMLYAGPQEQSILKQVAPGLDLVVDYGWLTVVAAPIFWALEAIHKLVGNWPLNAPPWRALSIRWPGRRRGYWVTTPMGRVCSMIYSSVTRSACAGNGFCC